MSDEGYTPDECDLCGAGEWSPLALHEYAAGMWSDSRVSERPLRKRVCARCGLTRDGNTFTVDDLNGHYRDLYQLNAADAACEHQFYREGRWIARSEALAEVMCEALAAADEGRAVSSIFEVGAGQGRLLQRLGRSYPEAVLAGCEPNRAAAAMAAASGLAVVAGDEQSIEGRYDLIVASFVLEHVPSPTRFLRRLAEHLTPTGRIVIALPMQDVESHDVYFVDHLHHFCTSHVEWVANHAGLAQVAICRSPWFAPNASVHVFEPAQQRPEIRRLRSLALEQAVAYWERVFANCRSIPRGCYAIFGGGEFAGLLRCYGGLDRFGPAFVLDDRPERYPDGALGLPVFALDARTDADLDGIDAVILALNPVYHASVRRRCADRGIAVINPFEAPARV